VATVTLSFPGWNEGKVAPYTFRALVTDPKGRQP
jgi:hypothetical protein